MLQDTSNRKQIRGMSKSQDFDLVESSSKKLDKLSKSCSCSASTEHDEPIKQLNKAESSVPNIDFGLSKEEKLDMIDRVEIH